MLGSANFEADPALRFMSGNLCHQIEHHLYPDLPSNRLHEISCACAQICEKYDLPYTTGYFLVQYGKTWRTIAKLSLPDKYLRDTADDAPETRSERMFADLEPVGPGGGVGSSRPSPRCAPGAATSDPARRLTPSTACQSGTDRTVTELTFEVADGAVRNAFSSRRSCVTPSSLHCCARIDRLHPTARRTLHAAAVIRTHVDGHAAMGEAMP